MSSIKRLVLIGAGGHGRVVLEAAQLGGWQVVCALDDDVQRQGQVIDGVSVVGCLADLAAYKQCADAAFVALGDSVLRERIHDVVRRAGLPLACIVHPRSCAAEFACLGEGTVVLAGAVVNVHASLGEGSIVNCNAVVDHDASLEAFVHVAPLAAVGARAKVGRGAVLGMGARVLQDAVVATGAQVAAGAVIGLD